MNSPLYTELVPETKMSNATGEEENSKWKSISAFLCCLCCSYNRIEREQNDVVDGAHSTSSSLEEVVTTAPVSSIAAIPKPPVRRQRITKIPPVKHIPEDAVYNFIPRHWQAKTLTTKVLIYSLDFDDNVRSNILSKFSTWHTASYDVRNVERIENVYSYLTYLLRKEETQVLYGNTYEGELFHGTKGVNLSSICANNFDWRRHGKNWGHRFGQGVSFAPQSSYASHYTDEYPNYYFRDDVNKMLLARVLLGHESLAQGPCRLPVVGDHTTVNEKRTVFVKYDDHSFYPEYIISYAGKIEKKRKRYY